nr:GNAT family N-acetyltransferase [Pseudonocardia sp. C8]
MNRRTATKARSNERAGYACAVVPGPQAGPDLLAGFHTAYTETMVGVGAAARYLYSPAYLAACLTEDSSWLVVVHGPDGDVAAAALVVRSDGVLHYHLGGTADAHRAASPAKNMMIAMTELAETVGVPLNLGGGMTEGDSLHRFKSLFANTTGVFATHDLVGDPQAYRRLARRSGEAGDFFPAYRSPAVRA